MDHNDNFYQQIQDAEKEQRRQERREKWAEREKNFWKTFLFTEDGKPKSGLMTYTFCLSIVLLFLYGAAFYFSIELLTPVMEGLPVFLGNLLQSLAASVAVILLCCVLHHFLTDKRLMFCSHVWLVVYAVAALVTLLIMLRGTDAAGAMLTFFGWFVLIPVALGTVVFFLLYRRDYVSASAALDVPEWKKYTQRR